MGRKEDMPSRHNARRTARKERPREKDTGSRASGREQVSEQEDAVSCVNTGKFASDGQ